MDYFCKTKKRRDSLTAKSKGVYFGTLIFKFKNKFMFIRFVLQIYKFIKARYIKLNISINYIFTIIEVYSISIPIYDDLNFVLTAFWSNHQKYFTCIEFKH